jgi:TfoX/Sxy family transcriptional regulator of competence genes
VRRGRALDPDYIHDLFASFGSVTLRRMFSGAGIFSNGLMFGLIQAVLHLSSLQGAKGCDELRTNVFHEIHLC